MENFIFGSSKNIFNRLKKHFSDLRLNHHENPLLQNSFNKYGEFDNKGNNIWISEILEECLPEEEIFQKVEQKWLDETRCYDRSIGYNICEIARRPPVLKGENHPFFKYSYLREIISKSSKEYHNREDVKENFVNYMNSPEVIEKRLKKMKGDLNPMKNPEIVKKMLKSGEEQLKLRRKAIVRINIDKLEDKKIYESMLAAKKDGFDLRAIARILKKKKNNKTHKGYFWEYLISEQEG